MIIKNIQDQKVLATASLLSGKDGMKYKHKLCPDFGEDTGVLKHVGVLPEFHRCGLGNAVVSASLNQAKENGLKRVFLATSSAQTAALAMYGKLGFSELNRVKTVPFLEFYEIILEKKIE